MPEQLYLQTSGPRRISKTECLSIITEPLTRDEGFRHGWIGYTGCGKTYNTLATIDASEGAHKYLIVTDQKARVSPYSMIDNMAEVSSVDGIDSVEPDNRNHKMCIVRGPRMTGDENDVIDFDALASKIWQYSLEDRGVLFGIDELTDACSGDRTWLKGDSTRAYMRLLYQQGRANKVSIVTCTQHVQEVPRAAISNSDTLGIFRQDRKELRYYATSGFLDARELEIVANLKQYEFLFVKRGTESAICRF